MSLDSPSASPKSSSSGTFGAFEVWGITGGIASGKSTAAEFFRAEGLPVVDADQVARELSLPGGAAHASIFARFGTDDRARLREIIFSDSSAKRDLEGILHPLIVNESLRRMRELVGVSGRQGAASGSGENRALVLYEAALLVETGRYRQLTGLIVVDSPRALRRERLIQRDGASPELADKILASQISDEERIKAATHVISNSGTLDELRVAVRGLISRLGWR